MELELGTVGCLGSSSVAGMREGLGHLTLYFVRMGKSWMARRDSVNDLDWIGLELRRFGMVRPIGVTIFSLWEVYCLVYGMLITHSLVQLSFFHRLSKATDRVSSTSPMTADQTPSRPTVQQSALSITSLEIRCSQRHTLIMTTSIKVHKRIRWKRALENSISFYQWTVSSCTHILLSIPRLVISAHGMTALQRWVWFPLIHCFCFGIAAAFVFCGWGETKR